MKWISHKIITGIVIHTITGDVFATFASMAGSIMPDAIEGSPDNNPLWRKYHRGLTHWFVPYLSIALILLITARSKGMISVTAHNFIPYIMQNTSVAIMFYAGFFLFGCSMHIFEDFFCGKIPSLNPKKRIGRNLFYVGSQTEYAITLSAIIVFVLIKLIGR